MTPRPELLELCRIRISLAREHETDITCFIPDRHTVRKRTGGTGPAQRDLRHGEIARARGIKCLVQHASNHALNLPVVFAPGGFRDDSCYAWHFEMERVGGIERPIFWLETRHSGVELHPRKL